MDHVAPPADLPRAPGWRDRWRLLVARVRTRGGLRAGAGVAVGRRVRFDVARGAVLELGDHAVVGDGCRFHVRGGRVCVGAGTTLGARCAVVAHREVLIGGRCLLADEVVVSDIDQAAADVEAPVRLQGLRVEPVRIGDGARLGPGAAVLRGVAIGAGAVVGAHAVVARDVAPGGEATGVPAAAPAQSSRSRRSRR